MRARSAKQRFPVAQWKENLGTMQDHAIKMSQKQVIKHNANSLGGPSALTTVGAGTNISTLCSSRLNIAPNSIMSPSEQTTRAPSPSNSNSAPLSMGSRIGPGHAHKGEGQRGRKKLSKPRPESRDSSVQSRKGIKHIFPRSGRSSRATSPKREQANDAQIGARDVPPPPLLPPIPITANRPLRRVSRITEDSDEDRIEPASGSQGDLSRFDFTNENPFDDSATTSSIYSVHEDSEYENSVDDAIVDEYVLTAQQVENEREKLRVANLHTKLEAHAENTNSEGSSRLPFAPSLTSEASTPSIPGTPRRADSLMITGSDGSQTPVRSNTGFKEPDLSLREVLQGKKNYNLQNVEPSFNDPTGLYYQVFEHKLQKLNGKSSETSLCIEEYLKQSEKDWFNRYRNVKLGKSAASSRASSIFRVERARPNESTDSIEQMSDNGSDEGAGQFLLQDDYTPPKGVKKLVLRRIGTWPLYTFFLALVSWQSSQQIHA